MYNDTMGRVGCFLVFSGFCLTFFPQFVMGSRGMPRRYASYDPEFEIFHQLSTVGAFVLGIGIVLSIIVLVYAAFRGPKCGGNPFGAASLEWQSSSPPDFHNFIHKPVMSGPYDFSTQIYDEELDTYVHRDFTKPAPDPSVEPQPDPDPVKRSKEN